MADATKHRALRIASLAHTKAESVGESYSRAVFGRSSCAPDYGLAARPQVNIHTVDNVGVFTAC
ncbi:hypothetical protein AHiyo1_29400 [Arthrobacter sp. Hiyo1]|uniref:Uncharacterized protein n=1 Tax=Arthrobacter bambusae TaxID=1338426 RepID=A0AAW8DMS4_9MICC|nr:hypothetical protein [Arthrobacter bambusae]MDQ0131910.1 hypothetical protein [Arthrobacter bambusae]MDQ0183265.1 hypothetical protein [Arthrobacter bambusae]MDQ0240907.1 hypothetical protein [Arthrobacter bambusae]GAP59606.1 hypothetical protein AHiyo1_29400 [Arthrobacter sp. Hiyo1]